MDFLPGDKLLYMKVGVHAQETLDEIIERKRQEIVDEGFAMWGYGGNACHPLTMVQPFVSGSQSPVWLAMQPMKSKHNATPDRATEYSNDGVNWQTIPPRINVLGSRWALCIDDLQAIDTRLDLGSTEVALGPSQGRKGTDYIQHQVDKACLSVTATPLEVSRPVELKLAARIIEPYAVFVRD